MMTSTHPWIRTAPLLLLSLLATADPNDQSGDLSAAPMPGASTPESWDRLAQQEVAAQSQRAIYAPARDLDMELALMRKLDPAAVTKVEGTSSAAAK
jgi:hypothetical protein